MLSTHITIELISWAHIFFWLFCVYYSFAFNYNLSCYCYVIVLYIRDQFTRNPEQNIRGIVSNAKCCSSTHTYSYFSLYCYCCFILLLRRGNCLITYFVCIKFVWCNLKFLHRTLSYWAIFHNMLKYFLFLISNIKLQCLISYCHKTVAK